MRKNQRVGNLLPKVSIAYKEARETKYWIKLLNAANYLDDGQAKSLLADVEELLKIIEKIQITTKEKLRITNDELRTKPRNS